jgi:hypothetical protein
MSFDALLPSLAEKWRELPSGSDLADRRFADDLLNLSVADLSKHWEREYDSGIELRGWYWRLYRDTFRNRKVLEIGSGMRFDAMDFASHGADWTCCDIARSNLQVIGRVAAGKRLDIRTLHISSIKSFDALPSDFDFVWCNGSLINLPFELAREESAAILPHLKRGGRWIELAYPRERWVRDGGPPFSEWGKMTDGDRTPWVEWYDMERLKQRLHPGHFETVLEYRFNSNNYIWMDAMYGGDSLHEDTPRVSVASPAEAITTPPHLWNWAWSTPLNDAIRGKAITAEIICSAESGAIGFAFERDGRFVSPEVLAEARSGNQLLYVSTSTFCPGTRLTARNASALGPSRLKIESITLRPTL